MGLCRHMKTDFSGMTDSEFIEEIKEVVRRVKALNEIAKDRFVCGTTDDLGFYSMDDFVRLSRLAKTPVYCRDVGCPDISTTKIYSFMYEDFRFEYSQDKDEADVPVEISVYGCYANETLEDEESEEEE